MRTLQGVVIPVAVPLTSDHGLDQAGLRRLVQFLVNQKVHGLFANGSMGAFALLPDALQFEVIQKICEFAEGRLPVLAGASETSTSRVLQKIRTVERMPVEAVVVLPPYYYLCQQSELLAFYQRVAEASQKPIFLYDNPRLTQNPLEVDTIAELARHPNIRGLKISAADAFKWQELLRRSLPREKFALFAGAEKMMSLALQLGFDGVTGGLHNVAPNLAVAMVEAARRGDFQESDRIQQKINRIYGIFEIDGGWRGLEVAFQFMGICHKVTAHPYELDVAPQVRQSIETILQEESVLRPFPGPQHPVTADVSVPVFEKPF